MLATWLKERLRFPGLWTSQGKNVPDAQRDCISRSLTLLRQHTHLFKSFENYLINLKGE